MKTYQKVAVVAVGLSCLVAVSGHTVEHPKTAMEARYNGRFTQAQYRLFWESDDRAYLTAIAGIEGEIKAFAEELLGEGYERDWQEGVDGLALTQPDFFDASSSHNSVRYVRVRETGELIGGVSRYLRLMWRQRGAAKVATSCFSLARQMISLEKKGRCFTVISASMANGLLFRGARELHRALKACSFDAELLDTLGPRMR